MIEVGLQYIETIEMYSKNKKKLKYPSELQCYDRDNRIAVECRDIIFNGQYGIFYYEPASKKEAQKMIKGFREKIDELEKEVM